MLVKSYSKLKAQSYIKTTPYLKKNRFPSLFALFFLT